MAINLGETSLVAEESLNQLAEIDLAAINAADLRSARIQVGLVFIGFGALANGLSIAVSIDPAP